MKVDCRWFSANLEAFFCDELGAEELQMASEHLKTCLSCRSEVQALRDVDPLVKQLLAFRMTKSRLAAHAPKRSLGFQIGMAGAAMAVAGILFFVIFLRPANGPSGLLPDNQTANQGPDSPDDGKVNDVVPTPRAKPDAPDPKSPAIQPGPEPAITDNSPAFLVKDAAGYSTSLEDYRGRILLVGVWSADQPEAAQNIQKLYQAFGSRKEVRVLGVSSRAGERLAGVTFPMVYNNGSRLLETPRSNFVVVDKSGSVQMRGTLLGDSHALTTKIGEKLDDLGGR